ncbi:sensor histidine kinase [Actinocorallia libanotica]|uniref:Signal transduction histidine kinase subgroup 3 dimerisation and phosphoacceptor domain-containing protein n=1 Tax=Actinocorallia libanotica TaxID=46162 RepID=A0ABN1RW98_9ACTN
MVIVLVVLAGVAFDPLDPVPDPPFALVLALQLLHCLTPWRKRRTLAAQLLLLPWAGPAAAGMVAASALLLLRGAARWCLFAAVAVTAVLLAPATPFEKTLALLNAVCQGLVLFGVTRLGDTRAALHATRAELAARTVAAERARAARELQTALGTALSAIIALAARGDAARTAETSRAAAARARAVPDTPGTPLPEPDLTPRLALPILLVVHAGYLMTALIYLGGSPAPALLATATLGLHLHHALPRPLPAPRQAHVVQWFVERTSARVVRWFVERASARVQPRVVRRQARVVRWTASVQLVLAVVVLLYPGQAYPQLAGFAVGGFLVLGRAWWPAAGVVTAAVAVVLAARGYSPAENLYWTFNTVAVAAMLYGLATQTALVFRAHEARRTLAALAAADERRRISRDVHDLLGYGLSAITVKAELAGRLASQAAGEQFAEIAGIARRSLSALRAIPDEPDPHLSLAEELHSSRSLLAASGVEVTVHRTSERDDALLAVVLREAVTNVLRHSSATRCRIEITRDGLQIVNDGASATRGAGRGTANLTARVTAAGGTLTAGESGGEYALTVLYPAVLRGDADGVEPVAGV